MLDHHVSCVAVLSDGGSSERVDEDVAGMVGMLTQADYLRRVCRAKLDGSEVQCGSVMTPAEDVAYVFSGNSVESCLAVMANVQCHHLPVLDKDPAEGGVLLGVVAMEELLGLTAEARQRSVGAIAHRIARLPGFAALGGLAVPSDAATRQ